MDDHNYIMCTSMAQYLQEMDSILQKNTIQKSPEDFLELTSEGKGSSQEQENQFSLDQIPDRSVALDFGPSSIFNEDVYTESPALESINPSAPANLESVNLEPQSSADQEAVVLCTDEDHKSNIEDDLQKLAISIPKRREMKRENLPKIDESFKAPKEKSKGRVSDKERARKSRLRKKKYYEDLEKKVVQLEDHCKKLTQEVKFYKEKALSLQKHQESTTFKTHLEKEVDLMNALQEKIESIDSDNLKVFETLIEVGKNFCGYGKNKLQVLEQCFDQFLENTLMGWDFKACLYSCDIEGIKY